MRIVSLVPSATELLFALGIGEQVVGVTHECDFPPSVLGLPHVTRDVLPSGLSAREIDAAVREQTLEGQAIYDLDEQLLAELAPDLIVTQALCAVCAVSYEDVVEVAKRLPTEPNVVSLDPHTLGEVLGDVRTVAEATQVRDQGVDLVQESAARIDKVKLAVRDAERVTVAALEWFDPIYIGGHWVPQMIELAGGIDVLGLPGEHSETRTWEELRAAKPQVIVAMPCGYDTERSQQEALGWVDELAAVGAERVVAVDAAAYFSRPGPRLIEGLEVLAHVLHPDRVPLPAGGRVLTVDI